MDLHTDRVDRTVGPRDNFGKVWAWTALVVFLGVLFFFESTNESSPMSMHGIGWHAAVAGFAAFAGLFPGVMIAAVVKFIMDVLED